MKKLVSVVVGALVIAFASVGSATPAPAHPGDGTLSCKPNGATCSASSECCGGWCVSTKNSSSRLVCSSHS